MYKIYVDNELLYVPSSEIHTVISPELQLEVNAAGSLQLTIPPTNPLADKIKRMKSVIKVEQDSNEIWAGRVTEDNVDFFNQHKIYCEGELAYLNDSIQPPHEFHDMSVVAFMEYLIEEHNKQVQPFQQFKLGMVTVNATNSDNTLYRYTNFESTLKAIKDKLVDRLGGYLRIRKKDGVRYIDYLAEATQTCNQSIEFGKNLLDFSKDFNASDIATAIIPLGAQLDSSPIAALTAYTTIESVNNGVPWIQSQSAVKELGWIVQTVNWNDVHEPAILKKKATKYLEEAQFEKLTLEVKAVDLHNLDTTIESVKLLDNINVISKPHGLHKNFLVTKRTIPLQNPENESFTLGSELKVTLTDSQKQTNEKLISMIENTHSNERLLEDARKNATEIINGATHGNIITEKDQILIMDTDNPKTAKHVWRWNLGGFGYSKNGVEGPFETAITMDGRIVADFIKAGILEGVQLISRNPLSKGYIETYGGVLMTHDENGSEGLNFFDREITFKSWSVPGLAIGKVSTIDSEDASKQALGIGCYNALSLGKIVGPAANQYVQNWMRISNDNKLEIATYPADSNKEGHYALKASEQEGTLIRNGTANMMGRPVVSFASADGDGEHNISFTWTGNRLEAYVDGQYVRTL